MKHHLITLFILTSATLLFLLSCSSAGVTTKASTNANFEAVKTFNFVPLPTDSLTGEPILDYGISRVIEAAIDHELGEKGYDISDDPDVWIAYWGKSQRKSQMMYAQVYMPPAYNYGPNAYGYGSGWGAAPVRSYKVGTLAIDVINAKTHELMWYGVGSDVLDPDPVKRNRNINVTVYKIFRQWRYRAE